MSTRYVRKCNFDDGQELPQIIKGIINEKATHFISTTFFNDSGEIFGGTVPRLQEHLEFQFQEEQLQN